MAKPPKRPRDMNELAVRIGKIATGELPNDPAPSATQERAAKGGEARAKKLTRRQRVAIASKGGKAAARARKKR
ncbi:MAG TPA: hypothetical protein VMY38_01565 [Gemmatimonadaceae bacterium]|nr:hypothetical protein [Gemmatimonadaceae bacterium]